MGLAASVAAAAVPAVPAAASAGYEWLRKKRPLLKQFAEAAAPAMSSAAVLAASAAVAAAQPAAASAVFPRLKRGKKISRMQ